jgi:DNA-binding transcriptional ArsR family regulator
MSGNQELADWVKKEMTVERGDVLVKAKERVSKLLGVTAAGEVEFRIAAEGLARLRAPDKILLYALGKLYAHIAGYAQEETVTAPELSAQLGLPKGTVDPTLKSLREAHLLTAAEKGAYTLPLNRVLEVLADIEEKLGA